MAKLLCGGRGRGHFQFSCVPPRELLSEIVPCIVPPYNEMGSPPLHIHTYVHTYTLTLTHTQSSWIEFMDVSALGLYAPQVNIGSPVKLYRSLSAVQWVSCDSLS